MTPSDSIAGTQRVIMATRMSPAGRTSRGLRILPTKNQ